MRILITGATGYVGNALVENLSGTHEIAAAARDVSKISQAGVQKVTVDILEPQQMRQVIRDFRPDIVIHAASLPKRSTADEKTFIETNVTGAHNVAETIRDYSHARLIIISSGCVFKQVSGTIINANSKREMETVVARSKNLAEDAVKDIFKNQPERVAIIYSPVILHPSQRQGIIPGELHRAQTEGVVLNKRPQGHISFVSHVKLAEIIDAIARDGSPQDTQRYFLTGNRFQTVDFFQKLQAVLYNNFKIPCEIREELNPTVETMCKTDESSVAALVPGFKWGSIDGLMHDIIGNRLAEMSERIFAYRAGGKGGLNPSP